MAMNAASRKNETRNPDRTGGVRKRNFENPWPRMVLACVLTVWAGANLWSAVFRWSDILTDDVANRTIGLLLSIIFALLPLVIAIYLFWSVVVGPDDEVPGKKQTKGSAKNSSRPKRK